MFIYFPVLDNINPLPIILISIGGVLLLAGIALAIYLIISNKKKKKVSGGVWLSALGDKDNIEDISGVGSRVTLILKDKEKIDRVKLKTLGVSSVLTMSNKIILVVEDQAVKVAEAIREEL